MSEVAQSMAKERERWIMVREVRSKLRKEGETTALTEAFETFCDGPVHKEQSPAAASKEQQDRADEPTNSTRNERPSRE